MRALVCEMCNSNDLVKQDGLYVCQNCGTKYSPEEAKKMMIGGTVKVDTSDRLENLYQIARRAKDENNNENAAKYYDMILVDDPASWEAAFYVVYFKAMGCRIGQISNAAYSLINCMGNVLGLINQHVSTLDEKITAVQEITYRGILAAKMLSSASKSHYDGIDNSIKGNYLQEFVDNVCASRDICYVCGDSIERVFSDNEEIVRNAAEAWKTGVCIHKEILPQLSNADANNKIISAYLEKIDKFDHEYAYDERKKNLETELAVLRKQEEYLKKFASSSPITPVVSGIVIIVIGVLTCMNSRTDLIMLLLGAGLIIIGVALAFSVLTRKQKLEEHQKQLANIQEKISAKESELSGLS